MKSVPSYILRDMDQERKGKLFGNERFVFVYLRLCVFVYFCCKRNVSQIMFTDVDR